MHDSVQKRHQRGQGWTIRLPAFARSGSTGQNETGRKKWMVAGQRYTLDLYAECLRTTTGKRAKTLLA